ALALAEWFPANQRDLPWRREWTDGKPGDVLREPDADSDRKDRRQMLGGPAPRRDPYATWISEIMLQQTQVTTVLEYYRKWMTRFPDLETLGAAEEKDVLEAWAGLGYYSRARNVLATARKVVEDHGGSFPWRREDLLDLKGIGEYTAGAIASLAFNLPEPILDGNLIRVFSRLYALNFLPDSKAGKQIYWDLAREWASTRAPGLVNEGLMELGALVCTPRGPDCRRCPLSAWCKAFAGGIQEQLPPARSRKDAVDVAGFAVAVFLGEARDGQVLLYTPRKPERLAGLFTFPVFPVSDLPALIQAWKGALPGLAEAHLRPRAVTVTHNITHHRYRLRIAEARMVSEGHPLPLPEGYEWRPVTEVDRLLVSSLPRKIWKSLK
nr:A/G-specific adenine glycosylase [Fibrobacterota bacterium]